jgi:hypothetical protein
MTVAAIEATILAASLREGQGEPGFERRVLERTQEAIYPAWWRSAIDDLRWPGVCHSGPEPLRDVPLLHRYFDLCLRQSTLRLAQLEQQGGFDPVLLDYFMMNWLLVSPRSVVNAGMLERLLEGETPAARQAILAELFAGYSQRQIDAVLAAAVPDFSGVTV